MAKWQKIETAPKGEPKAYRSGPRVLIATHHGGWTSVHIGAWMWHKNEVTGSWKTLLGVMAPTHWMPIPEFTGDDQ